MNIYRNLDHVFVGDVIYTEQSQLGPLTQGHVQLVYVYEGEIDIVRDGKAFRLEEGEITLILPKQRVQYLFAQQRQTLHGWCNLLGGALTSSAQNWFQEHQDPQVFSTEMQMLEQLLGDILWDSDPRQRAYREQLVLSLLALLLRDSGYPGTEEKALHPALLRATTWLRQHLQHPVTQAELAEEAGVSSGHLARLFREELGCSPKEWIWATRCETAADLLRYTALSSAEIAFRCGFSTPQHFSRLFSKRMGQPPGRFRSLQKDVES